MTLAQKKQTLDKLCEELTKSGTVLAGRASVVPEVAERMTIKFRPTPIPELNTLIGGGLPVGRIVLIAGQKDTGKTQFMLSYIAYQMKQDPKYICVWVESEESLDIYKAEKLHKFDPERFYPVAVSQKNKKEFGAEAVGNVIETAIKNSSPNIVVINSLKMLVPMSEMEKGMEKDTVGRQAAFNSKLMKKLTSLCAEHRTTLVLIQHYTTEIGGYSYGNPLKIAGGEAIRHANMLTMEFSTLSLDDNDPVKYGDGLKIKIRVTKNHCVYDRSPYGYIVYFIEFGKGFERIVTTLNRLVEQGTITHNGAWYYLLNTDGSKNPDFSWNGKAKFKADMEENPDKFEKLLALVSGNLEPGRLSDEEMEEIKKEEEEETNAVQVES